MDTKFKLPTIPHAFFRWYCRQSRYEEIHGDLEELYYERIETLGISKAKFMYWWDVIRCCQSYAWKIPKTQNYSTTMMLKNYLKTSRRSMIKNPLSSFINIFGLAVAIGICLVVYSFVDYDYSIDQFHKNKYNVYLSTFYVDRDGKIEQYGTAPTPLATMLKEDFSHVKKVCRMEDRNVVVKFEDHVFHERVTYTDATFLEMFTFPLKWGDPSTLADVNTIILSYDMAKKYFGEENPVGKEILVKFSEAYSKPFNISGVAEKFPKARAIHFNCLINFQNFTTSHPSYDLNDWSGFINATLVQVDHPSDINFVESKMDKYKKLQNEVQVDWSIESFKFEQLEGLHFKSGDIRGDISHDNFFEGRLMLPIIAGFMLILACFNYINIAIVSAAKRLKEIGLRKVVGANRRLVIVQFLLENVIVTSIALFIGLFLAYFMFLPWFLNISGMDLELKLLDVQLWIFLLGILIITGIASGIYPAFYISKFQAVNIFKGAVRFGKNNPLTKILLGFQLILACITITGAVMFTQNSAYQAKRSWGYNQKQSLYVKVGNQAEYEKLKWSMMQDPNVIIQSGSKDHLGKYASLAVIHAPDREYEVHQLSVEPNYFETMGIELKEGRFFQKFQNSDKDAIIVNELFVENLALTSPIGTAFDIDSARYEIIGVAKNFHLYNFYAALRPTIFKVVDPKDIQYLSLKVSKGKVQETYGNLQENWASLFPETPFAGGFQDDVWGSFYEELDVMQRFNRVVAYIAVLLASMGLYGLVTLNVSGRMREFSIRKALGAGLKNISRSVSKQYILLSVIALLIGTPLSFIVTKAQLQMLFAHHMPIDYSGVIIAVFILITVLLFVVFTQVYKVQKSDPVSGLRGE